ncbi:MAG TPA: acyltransferase family protein, partial [Promicromonospora sp.]|nr:acyltransferase family protein [Promicromonospora sp.]
AAAVLGWLGLVAIAVSGLVFSSSSAWPGYLALVPTLGTAAVIVAGFSAGRWGPAVLLSWRPAVWVGGLSYSLYLWHWPLIICATAYWGELGTKRGLLVMLASFVPAYLSYKLVENPIRFAPALSRSNRLTLSIGANCTLVGVLAGLVLALAVPSTSAAPTGDGEAAGAGVVQQDGTGEEGTSAPVEGGDGTVESLAGVEWFVPAAVDATSDVPEAYANDCQVSIESATPVACEHGDPTSDVVVVVVGDSKILQWESPLAAIAESEGWRMVFYTKSGCPFADAARTVDGKIYETCVQWNDAVLDEIIALAPDLVITSQRGTQGVVDLDDPTTLTTDAMVDGLATRWEQLVQAGSRVAVVLDNPAPDHEVYECVAEHPDDLAACTFSRERGVRSSSAGVQLEAAERVPGVTAIDLTDYICPTEECVPVIGNVLVYRQGSHITDTYARTLEGVLRDELVAVLDS